MGWLKLMDCLRWRCIWIHGQERHESFLLEAWVLFPSYVVSVWGVIEVVVQRKMIEAKTLVHACEALVCFVHRCDLSAALSRYFRGQMPCFPGDNMPFGSSVSFELLHQFLELRPRFRRTYL